MDEIKVFSIGRIVNQEDGVCLVLEPGYAAGLKGLKDFSHVQVLWWADGCDNYGDRNTLTEKKTIQEGSR